MIDSQPGDARDAGREHRQLPAFVPDRKLLERANDAKPEQCSWKRGARPSRSLCSASRRTDAAADSTYRLVRQGECCQLVGGTSRLRVGIETTALPIFNYTFPVWLPD